jgi:NAD(P)-dependent dehydrogenase (short-subunit alcohol dehydrogenase family)
MTVMLKGDEATVENFDRLMAVNARGTMLCYKHAGKQMIAQGRGGRIIGAFPLPLNHPLVFGTDEYFTAGACSLAGKQGSNIASSYSASKFAIRGLTQAAGMPYRNPQHSLADGLCP